MVALDRWIVAVRAFKRFVADEKFLRIGRNFPLVVDFSSQSALTIGQFCKADAITFFVRFKGASVTKTVKSRNDVAMSPPSDSTFLLKAFTWRGLNPELNSTRCVKVTPLDSFVVFCDFFALVTAVFVVGARFFFSPLVFL